MPHCSRRLSLTLTLAMAGATLFLASAGSAGASPAPAAKSPTAAVPTPKQVAKAPVTMPVGSAAVSPAHAVKASSVRPPTPKASTPFKLAQLDYPAPATASVDILMQAADDYFDHCDWAGYRRALEQVIASHPGTKEAGFALGVLVDQHAYWGDQAKADACAEALEGYSDPEVQAYAALVRTGYPLGRSKAGQRNDELEQLFAAYVEQWKGTASGGRAALYLGDYYRGALVDYPRALATYASVAKGCAGTVVGEEALVILGETYHWSIPQQSEKAQAVFEQALDSVHYAGLQVRCLEGVADILSRSGSERRAVTMLTQLIAAYPTHPAIPRAHAIRSIAAERAGDWDLAVTDARTFLSAPTFGTYNMARCHLVLAKDAYRKGNLDEAVTEFAAASKLAEDDHHVFDTSDWGGPAQQGLAAVAQDRGDLRGALACLVKAADIANSNAQKEIYLYQAADLAQQLHDEATRTQIITRMSNELPGSHLTTKLVGHEILPAQEP